MKTPARLTFKTLTFKTLAFKTLATAALAAGLLAVGAAAASAHVHLVPDDPAANGYTHLTFSVPNESPTAKTKKLVVRLPTDPPFTSVSVKPLDGWTAQVVTTELPKPVTVEGSTVTKAATSVIWTADAAHEIGQNQYQTFSLSVGKLPAAGTTITLPAAQSYTDGTVVDWDQKSIPGQAEPDHPAPSFVTTAEDGAAPSGAPVAESEGSGSAASVWGIVLGAAGLLVGGTALGMVLAARRRNAGA